MELRAEGKRAKEIAEIVGMSAPYVSQLAATYFAGGIESIAGNHYGGNRRNMTVEEEELILKPFYERAEKGEIIEVSEIEKAYQEKVDHKISSGRSGFWSNQQTEILLVQKRYSSVCSLPSHQRIQICLRSG